MKNKSALSQITKIISILTVVVLVSWWGATLTTDVKHLISIVEPLVDITRSNENRITILEVLAGLVK